MGGERWLGFVQELGEGSVTPVVGRRFPRKEGIVWSRGWDVKAGSLSSLSARLGCLGHEDTLPQLASPRRQHSNSESRLPPSPASELEGGILPKHNKTSARRNGMISTGEGLRLKFTFLLKPTRQRHPTFEFLPTMVHAGEIVELRII